MREWNGEPLHPRKETACKYYRVTYGRCLTARTAYAFKPVDRALLAHSQSLAHEREHRRCTFWPTPPVHTLALMSHLAHNNVTSTTTLIQIACATNTVLVARIAASDLTTLTGTRGLATAGRRAAHLRPTSDPQRWTWITASRSAWPRRRHPTRACGREATPSTTCGLTATRGRQRSRQRRSCPERHETPRFCSALQANSLNASISFKQTAAGYSLTICTSLRIPPVSFSKSTTCDNMHTINTSSYTKVQTLRAGSDHHIRGPQHVSLGKQMMFTGALLASRVAQPISSLPRGQRARVPSASRTWPPCGLSWHP